MWIISDDEKKIIASLVAKGRKEQEINERFAVIDFESFYRLFSDDENALIKKYMAIDPKTIGYKLPYLGVEEMIDDIVPIRNQKYFKNGQRLLYPCRYLPRTALAAYEKMNATMLDQIKKELLVSHGYRSPAQQIFLFFDVLERIYQYNFQKTIQRVCFPGYSEHGHPKQQAIDFMTQEGIKGEEFAAVPEYQWLKEYAGQFHFFESYPKGNTLGMMYEPWHWHYEVH